MKYLANKKLGVLIFTLLIVLSSCANLSKRFKGYDTKWIRPENVNKYVSIKVESYKIKKTSPTPSKQNDIFNLSPNGQSELIKAISSKTKDVDELINELTKKLSSTSIKTNKVRVFPMSIKKSIVFSVDKHWASKGYKKNRRILKRIGDRISNLEMSLTLDSKNDIEFMMWDKLVTDRVTVDLGKVTSSQEWSVTGNVNASVSSEKNNSTNSNTNVDGVENDTSNNEKISKSIGPSANANFKDKYESSIDLLISRIKLSGTLSKDNISLKQEGAFGIDLSGNTSVSVEYNYKGDYAKPIFVFKTPKYYNSVTPIHADKLIKNKIMWIFPNVTRTTVGEMKYKYFYRHVKRFSSKHIPESRQRASYFYGEVGHTDDIPALHFELISPKDFKPVTYRIGFKENAKIVFLKWDNDIINFETSKEAALFLEYLINLTKTSNDYSSTFNIFSNNEVQKCILIKHQN